MKRFFSISAIGKDRPGIMADVSELVYECGCNLEDSNSARLENQFALLMIVSGTGEEIERRLAAGCKRLEWEKHLTVFFSPLQGVRWRREEGLEDLWELTAIGVDTAGIVCKVTRILAGYGMNIEKMDTYAEPSPESGTPIFHMKVRLTAPLQLDAPELHQKLEQLGNRLAIDIVLRPIGESGHPRTQ
jgi:glycine cleavage system transcriptional repressor